MLKIIINIKLTVTRRIINHEKFLKMFRNKVRMFNIIKIYTLHKNI